MFIKRFFIVQILFCLLFTSLAAIAFGQDENPVFQTVRLTGDLDEPYPSVFFSPYGKINGIRIWADSESINHELYGSRKLSVSDAAFEDGLVLDENGVTAEKKVSIKDGDFAMSFESFGDDESLLLMNEFGEESLEFFPTGGFNVYSTLAPEYTIVRGNRISLNAPTPRLELQDADTDTEWEMKNDGNNLNFSVDGDQIMLLDSFGRLRLQSSEFEDQVMGMVAGEIFSCADRPSVKLFNMNNDLSWRMDNADVGHLVFYSNVANRISMLDTGGMQVKTGNKLVEFEDDDARLYGSNPELKLESTAADNSIVARTSGFSSSIEVTANSGIFHQMLTLRNNTPLQMSLFNTAANANWIMANDIDGRFVLTRAGSGVAEFSIKKNGDLILNGAVFNSSDRNKKKAFKAVDTTEVLAKVVAMPVTTWQYKTNDANQRHMGPMAQDFRAAFGLGESDKTLATVDGIGVSLAAIKGLNNKVEGLKKSNEDLSQQLQQKDERIDDLEERLEQLMSRMESLESASTK